MAEPIYPNLDDSINRNINKQRADKLLLMMQSYQHKLKHYQKIIRDGVKFIKL